MRKITFLTTAFLLIIGLTVFISSCGGEDDNPQPVKVATSIELVSGGDQTAILETALTNPIEVIVKDQDGNAFSDAIVNFAISEGSVSIETATTDVSGKASLEWTLGASEGLQVLIVTIFNGDGVNAMTNSPIIVKATASPVPLVATSIELVTGGDQTAIVETTLNNPIEVIVKDQNGNAFSGATVNFAITEGSVSSETATTDVSGKASIEWTLGATEGEQELIVSAFKSDEITALTNSPIIVTSTASPLPVATSIELINGGNQAATMGTILANSIEILVKDQNGDAFAGEVVNFAVAEGSVSLPTVTSDSNGKASITWSLGTSLGIQKLTVTAFKADGTTILNGSPLEVTATATEPLILLIGSYSASANSYIYGSETYEITTYPDYQDKTKLWITNFIKGGTELNIYGIVDLDAMTISIPVGQLIVNDADAPAEISGYYGPNGLVKIADGGFITGNIDDEGNINIEDEYGSEISEEPAGQFYNLYYSGANWTKTSKKSVNVSSTLNIPRKK